MSEQLWQSHEQRPFCTCVCPVCHQAALQGCLGEEALEIHCAQCGSFDGTHSQLASLRKMNDGQRMEWLRAKRAATYWAVRNTGG
jgi:hypothetical protein